MVICGWQAILAGASYLGGNMILALAELNHPDFSPALWQGTLAFWAVLLVAILINTFASTVLPQLESFMLILHIGGFFAIMIPLVVVGGRPMPISSPVADHHQMAPQKVSAHDVFTIFENGGGWPSTTMSVFVGLLGSVFATYGT